VIDGQHETGVVQMIAAFMTLALTASSLGPADPSPLTSTLVDLLRLTDEYRQCLILDKTRATEPRDSYFAEGGTSAENLDLSLSDRTDHLFKKLIEQGRQGELVDAFRRINYGKVDESQCKDFDPYFGPADLKLMEAEKLAGIPSDEAREARRRGRPQRPRRN
jgi:hypothetical protein